MSVTVEWSDVLLRLVLTVAAGASLGLNRSERGRAAGLCTMSLVCLAACVAMIQTNLLLTVTGKTADSFVNLDVMRLPLGILTGMGFIGGGAILRRGDMIQGVTTAATLWVATVVGLCLGGGQLALGLTAWALALGILPGLKWVELRLRQERRATLILCAAGESPTEEEIAVGLLAAGYSVASWAVTYKTGGDSPTHTMRCEVRWHGRLTENRPPALVQELAKRAGVQAVRWKGQK
jgi:putative Mg2+ transporter-C (MgtC) family protein